MGDGSGRDTYILKENGGLCSEAKKERAKSTMFIRETPSKSPIIGFKPTPTFKYISDGSGRDFYVTHSSGGLQAPYVPGIKRSDAQF